MSKQDQAVGPVVMARQLIDALGLQGVKGIMKLQITVESCELPKLTVVRSITHEQAGAVCALLKEWQCELVPTAPAIERRIKADGSIGEAEPPLFPSLHPREG